MADGITWDDLPTELEGPGTEIRRTDRGGLALCLLRLEKGVDTRPLFKGMPDDECQCTHWGYMISGTIRVHTGRARPTTRPARPTTGRRATTSRRSPTASTSRSRRPTSTTC